VNLSPLEPK